MAYWEKTIMYNGSGGDQPPGSYSGETMKEWAISGRAGDTPFKIYGRTVYLPRQ
jgi:hypothetical protein